jgi:hypothetical protein
MATLIYRYNNNNIDFSSIENKTVLMVDVTTYKVYKIFQVDPNNRVEMAKSARDSRVAWNFPADWSGLPVDIVSIDTLYNFFVVESINENLFYNNYTLPSTSTLDSDGNSITIPGQVIKSLKTLVEISTAVTAAGLTLFDLELPKLYAGYAEPNNPLFVEPAMPA